MITIPERDKLISVSYILSETGNRQPGFHQTACIKQLVGTTSMDRALSLIYGRPEKMAAGDVSTGFLVFWAACLLYSGFPKEPYCPQFRPDPLDPL